MVGKEKNRKSSLSIENYTLFGL